MIFDLLLYFIFKIGVFKSVFVIFFLFSVCGCCKILKIFLICFWKNVIVNWLLFCEILICVKQLVIYLFFFCVRLQLLYFIILVVKDLFVIFLWYCKYERYFLNVSRLMILILVFVVVKELGSLIDWGKDLMKFFVFDIVQLCIVVFKVSLLDLYFFIILMLWNV